MKRRTLLKAAIAVAMGVSTGVSIPLMAARSEDDRRALEALHRMRRALVSAARKPYFLFLHPDAIVDLGLEGHTQYKLVGGGPL